ncbi:hypothetical protein CEXT_232391 [Caerostris extrusa]|uniref:Ycf15 n=1 Tax=Caerostris extrusa TaxID=172846 RepID=A0AAV4N6I1_CAEEX|nr:hypothetical protein CEXT_232391 [Caerostris extrusa]
MSSLDEQWQPPLRRKIHVNPSSLHFGSSSLSTVLIYSISRTPVDRNIPVEFCQDRFSFGRRKACLQKGGAEMGYQDCK